MRFGHVYPALLLALAGVAGCHSGPKQADAKRAWIRLAGVPGRPAAAYVTVDAGVDPLRLLSVESDQAGSTELHESMQGGSMASMKRVDGIDIPANGRLILAPGRYHAMLFGIDPKARSGGVSNLRLRFAKGKPISVSAKIVAAGDPAPY